MKIFSFKSTKHLIVIQDTDGTVNLREARLFNGHWMCKRWDTTYSDFDVLLQPNGVIKGPCYVKRWYGSLPGVEGFKGEAQ